MEDREPRALDAEWQKLTAGENDEAERMGFYLGAATVHRLVQDCFKRAAANRRDGASERETLDAALTDLRRCLLEIVECANDFMTDIHADMVRQLAARPDNAEALELRRKLARAGPPFTRSGEA